MTRDEAQAIVDRHRPDILSPSNPEHGRRMWAMDRCDACYMSWPCDARRAADAVLELMDERDAMQRRAEAAEADWQAVEARDA